MNGKLCEKEILHTFHKIFKRRTDIGSEYFEGEYKKMINIMFMIVQEVENIEDKIINNDKEDNTEYLEYIKKDKEIREKERIEKYKAIEENKNKIKDIKISRIKKKEEKKDKKEEKKEKKHIKNIEKEEHEYQKNIIEKKSITDFLSHSCEITNNKVNKIPALELFLKYKNSQYNKNIDIKKFAIQMAEINKIEKKRTNKGFIYVGIKYI
jgi:hypothetical protein